MRYEQTFFAYVEAGEQLNYALTNVGGHTLPVDITITDPTGIVQQACTVPVGAPAGAACSSPAGGSASTVTGVWMIHFDPNTASSGARFNWSITVNDGATVIPGRTWVERYSMVQPVAGTGSIAVFSLWPQTREGYGYKVELLGFGGIDSSISSNGFGLVEPGTCTPSYRSFDSGQYSEGAGCGDQYKLFLEAPAADLPATAISARGEEWVRPAVVPPSATGLTLEQEGPFSRAGEITFDLAGVNGGYIVQIDADGNGVFTDAVDRTIPWGSPPGRVEVPFDGLDGRGNALSVCAPLNARVVVDRVGEAHMTLFDVERLGFSGGAGLRVTGNTPGVVAANPRLYWDDRALVGGGAPIPYADGRAGVDTTGTLGAHGWTTWGNNRAIENWTYYQAQAGVETVIPSACDAALTLQKDGLLDDANGNGLADVGETVDYTFTVANAGNAPVAGVTIQDDRVTGIAPASADVPVFGESVFTAAPYTVTQADVDAGGVPNVASAAGVDPLGDDVVSNDATDLVPTVERAPELALDKIATLDDANGNGLADAGETIDYTFEVENTGNVTITGVAIDDPNVTGLAPAAVDLAPGASATFTAAAYTVTQADLNVGSVDNTAVATGTSPTGPVLSNADSATTPTPVPNPQLLLDKTAALTTDGDGDGRADVGDTVTYTFTVQNTGNIDVTDVTIADPRIQGTTPGVQDVPAGASATFTATYAATQQDVDFGSVPNTATANGTYVGVDGPTPIASAPDTAVVSTPDQTPVLALTKDGELDDVDGDGVADVGETIDYAFTVQNTGNVTMENVTVFDDRVATIVPATATIPPGGEQTFTATGYVVTQADVDAGEVVNTAYARGNVPGGPEAYSPTDEHVEDAAAAAPALTIDKIATLIDGNGNGTADEGEQISYAFLVTNAGNVTLTEVAVDDDAIAASLPSPIDFLPPGSSYTFEAAAYTVTAEDVDAGSIVNTASAYGLDPTDEPVVSDEDTATILATANALLTLEKSAVISTDADGDGLADVGDVITYTFEVENLGNVEVTDVTIDDPRVDGTTPGSRDVPAGESRIFTATYTTTQADVDFGAVPNTATANGTYDGADGPTPISTDPSFVSVPTPAWAPSLTLAKDGELDDANDNGVADAGETIVYSLTVTNDGNVTLTDVEPIDDRVTDLAPGPATLEPGDAETFTAAPYTVTQADVDAGEVLNTAFARGSFAGEEVLAGTVEHVEPTPEADADLSIEKSTGIDGEVAVGDEIVYSFLVTNTGNVTVDGIVIDDPSLAAAGIAVSCPVTVLAPDEATTCSADQPRVVTEADLLAGGIENTATVDGLDPDDAPVESDPDTITTPTQPASPELAMIKSAEHDDADGDGAIDVGETILYSFAVTNPGTLTITDVVIDDSLLDAAGITIACDATTVAPGETILCVADAPYAVTQADVDAGRVVNTALAAGTTLAGEPIESPESETTTPADLAPAMTSIKSADLDDVDANGVADAGETIVFTVTIENTGNVTLTDVRVDDPMIAVDCPATILAPGATMDCVSAPYTVTAADAAAGEVVNTATTTGSTPGGDEVSSTTNTSVTPAGAEPTPSPTPAPTPGLPQTGSDLAVWVVLLLATLLTVGGASMLIAQRARRER